MTKLIDALSARTNFGKLMEQAQKKQVRFLVSRRGKPQVIVLGVDDYLKNIIKQPKLLTDIQLDAESSGLGAISDVEVNAEITAFRRSKKRVWRTDTVLVKQKSKKISK